MKLDQPLFPRDHIQRLPGNTPEQIGPIELEGETISIKFLPGVEGDLARMRELKDFPDLYLATFYVNSLVEGLEGRTVKRLSDHRDVSILYKLIEALTTNEASHEVINELTANNRAELAKIFGTFINTCRELLPVLKSFTDTSEEADPIERFKALRPILNKIVEAHQAFYLKFREA